MQIEYNTLECWSVSKKSAAAAAAADTLTNKRMDFSCYVKY